MLIIEANHAYFTMNSPTTKRIWNLCQAMTIKKAGSRLPICKPSFLIIEKIEIRNCWCFCLKFKHSSQVLKALLQLACWTFEISKINHCTWITWKQFHLAWTIWLASTQVQTFVFVASSFIHPNPVGVQSSSLDHCNLHQITKNVCNKHAYHKSFWFRSKLCPPLAVAPLMLVKEVLGMCKEFNYLLEPNALSLVRNTKSLTQNKVFWQRGLSFSYFLQAEHEQWCWACLLPSLYGD